MPADKDGKVEEGVRGAHQSRRGEAAPCLRQKRRRAEGVDATPPRRRPNR